MEGFVSNVGTIDSYVWLFELNSICSQLSTDVFKLRQRSLNDIENMLVLAHRHELTVDARVIDGITR